MSFAQQFGQQAVWPSQQVVPLAQHWFAPGQQPAPLDEATIPCDEPTPGQHKPVEALQQLSPDGQQVEPQHDPLQHVPFVQQFCPAEHLGLYVQPPSTQASFVQGFPSSQLRHAHGSPHKASHGSVLPQQGLSSLQHGSELPQQMSSVLQHGSGEPQHGLSSLQQRSEL